MPAIAVYYDIATSRLDAQMQRIDQLDAKVATAYASASGILAVFAGLLSLTSLPPNTVVKAIVLALLGLSLGVYLALVLCLFVAYRVSEWSLRPDLHTLQADYEHYDDAVMREWIADECIRSIVANEPRIANKARWLYWALIALAFEALMLAGAGGVALLAR